jgi:predicted RNase H-like HicB family nuclease
MFFLSTINLIYYKNFTGTIEYCNVDNILYGTVINLPNTSISYHGSTIEEVINDFHKAIDFHLLPDEDSNSMPYEKAEKVAV